MRVPPLPFAFAIASLPALPALVLGVAVAALASGCEDGDGDAPDGGLAQDDAGAPGGDGDGDGDATDAGPPDGGLADGGSPRDAGGIAGDGDGDGDATDAGPPDGGRADGGSPSDAGGMAGDGDGDGDAPLTFKVVTFNTGTGTTNGVDDDGDAWTSETQAIGADHYGTGLAWLDAIAATEAFFAAQAPDLVAFQEIFHPEECPGIDPMYWPGFVCETWTPGAPTVAQMVLGMGYQVACNLGKPDKCAAVKTSFGSIRGCDADLCLDGMDGTPIDGCGGNGARVGRATIDLVAGGELTLVTMHGTSGFTPSDADCRIAQIEQVFLDMDGEPGANGARNVIMGDFNTDPGRATLVDSSADRWTDFVGDGEDFHFVTEVGFGVPPTYGNRLNIDHVVSDVFTGSCVVPGVTPGVDPVMPTVHFDHKPIVCTLVEP